MKASITLPAHTTSTMGNSHSSAALDNAKIQSSPCENLTFWHSSVCLKNRLQSGLSIQQPASVPLMLEKLCLHCWTVPAVSGDENL